MGRATLQRLLSLIALAALLGATANRLVLQAARWTTPENLVDDLTTEPGECLPVPSDAAQLAIGRAAFRAPLLLGGQAARLGLSCNSCHRGGHGNPGFIFPGVSGVPGTADVTTSILSSHRGDGQFNPRPIPDLSGPKSALKIDQSAASPQLAGFIRGLIVEEFDGPEPSRVTLEALASYVRSLSPALCAPAVPITLARELSLIDQALGAASAADPATAHMLIASARSALGRIDERFRPGALSHRAAGLRAAAAELGTIGRQLDSDPDGAIIALQRWQRQSEAWRRPLRLAERHSLYHPAMLRAARITSPAGIAP